MSAVLRNISRSLVPNEEEQKRLLRELMVRKLAEAQPVIANNPIPVLTRQPVPNVDIGPPPPPDLNWDMEAVSRNMPAPSYNDAGETAYPLNPPLIRSPVNQPIPVNEPVVPPTEILRRKTQPFVRFNDKGRPIGAEGGNDSLRRDQLLLEAQQGYKQPFSKKDFLLSSLSSFLRGGLPGVAGNALGFADPNYRKQISMGSDMADTEGRIHQGLLTRKVQNDWMNDTSRRGLEDARTQELLTREPKTNYGWIPNPTNPEGADIYAPLTPGLTRTVRKPKTSERAPLLRTKKNPDGSEVTLKSEDNGKTWAEIPDLISRPEPKADDSEFTNEQLNQNIREATTERDRIGASLKDIPTTIPGETYTVKGEPEGTSHKEPDTPNPAYTDLMGRYRELDDHIRTYRGQLKPGKGLTRGSSRDSFTEADVVERGKKYGMTPAAAIAKAKAAGLLK